MTGAALLLAIAGCAPTAPQDPFAALPGYRDRTVPIASAALFDPERFMGLWHEVARYPGPFQAGCSAVTMRFGAGSDGLMSVVSTCAAPDGGQTSAAPDGGQTSAAPDGGQTSAAPNGGQTSAAPDDGQTSLTGSATIVGPGRLQVSFGAMPFVAAEYWVLWVDESYRTAVIGTPNGRAAWILNRDPAIPADRLAAAREMLDFNGYDLTRLVRTGS